MNKPTDISEQIDAYILQTMTSDQRIGFEQQLAQNPVLAQEVKMQSQVVEAMLVYSQTLEIKQKLNGFHAQMDVANIRKITLQANTRQIEWWNYAKISAVAASISLLIMFMGFYINDKQQNAQTYRMLANNLNKINSIGKQQQSIWKRMSSNENEANTTEAISNGTGFPISTNGYLLTSYHLVKNAENIRIVDNEKKYYKAQLIEKDEQKDIAIIKIIDSNFKSFETLPYAFKRKPSKLGEYVYTLGYPKQDIVFGEGSISSTSGFQNDSATYQISIPLNPGNSGSPLIDNQGNLLGMIVSKNTLNDNAGFAVKSTYLIGLLDSLQRHHQDLKGNIVPSRKNNFKNTNKVQQIDQIQKFIYRIEVY